MGRFTKPTSSPEDCDHSTGCISLMGYTTTEDHVIEGDPLLDAVELCLDCHSIRLWGVGWLVPPPADPSTQVRLDALLEDGGPCEACGWLIGETLQCDNDECPANAP